jgi:hypothetical protein
MRIVLSIIIAPRGPRRWISYPTLSAARISSPNQSCDVIGCHERFISQVFSRAAPRLLLASTSLRTPTQLTLIHMMF